MARSRCRVPGTACTESAQADVDLTRDKRDRLVLGVVVLQRE